MTRTGSTRSVLVVGAGLAGLACAFDLMQAGIDVHLVEASEHAGGVVGTLARDGFLFESGPHGVPAGSECFRRLCGALGIAERLIVSPARDEPRWILHRGELMRVPTSVRELVSTPLLSFGSKLCVLSERLRRFTPPPDGSEPDLEQFLVERIGREAALRLGGAFVRGVYAAELRELGAHSAFPRMYELTEKHRGMLRGLGQHVHARLVDLPGPEAGMPDLMSFPLGLQELVDALAHALGERLRLRTSAERVEHRGEHWIVSTAAGEHIETDALVLAVPATTARRLLTSFVPSVSELAHLDSIRHGRIALVDVGFTRADAHLPRGFGFLVPPAEPGMKALGMIFASNLFPGRAPRDHGSVAAFYPLNELEGLADRERAERVARDLAAVLHLPAIPAIKASASWSWNEVIPRYSVGHAQRMRELETALQHAAPGLLLAGTYTGGVSVEQVLLRGRSCAAAVNAEKGTA